MMNKYFYFLFALLVFSSCSAYRMKTVKTTDIANTGVIQTPVMVDLDVSETKVSATVTSEPGQSIEDVKNSAVAAALKTVGADVLVEPVFEIEKVGGKTTVTVTGFPGTYKNFRSAKDSADIVLINSGTAKQASVYQPTEPHRRRNPAVAIVGALGIVGITLFLLFR